MRELVTKSFANQAMAFPDRVEQVLAKVETVQQAKDVLDQAATMQKYAQQLKAGVAVERPISIGVIKIKAKLGELIPKGKRGRGNKIGNRVGDFSSTTMTAFWKLAANKEKLDEYYDALPDDEVPTQDGFLKYASGGPHVSNNSGCNEWYTPPEYIEAAREVMGGIDLDPASSEKAQEWVKAKQYFTEADDGLQYEWSGRVWMNPPYARGLVEPFCGSLVDAVASGAVSQACVLVNNATDTGWFQNLMRNASGLCFIHRRVTFLDASGQPKSKPLQGQAVVYFGDAVADFAEVFNQFGCCLERAI